jgi:hypothetical protein
MPVVLATIKVVAICIRFVNNALKLGNNSQMCYHADVV